MTRNEVKELLMSAGVAEPTSEAIDNFLNKHNAEVQREKEVANKYKADATKVTELQEQLDALNSQNLTEIEKAQKETEKSNARVSELEKTLAIMQRKNALAEKGIIGEDAEKLFDAEGKIDIDILGQIISTRETAAKAQAEKDLLNKTPNPQGSNKDKPDELSDVEKMAKSVGEEIANMNKAATDVLAKYIN
jgi:DNA-binding helix-hairpin-helix protein with protein kinase domain